MRWAALLLTTAVCVLVLVSGAAAAPSPRIINGANAGASFGTRWPFAASLGTTGANSYSGHFCGGSLIIPRVVVTAAHCVESSTADGVTVTLGRYDLTTLTGHDYGVDRILLYPNYHQFGLDGDIALLELASAASEPTIQLVGANEGGMWGGGLGTAVSDPDGPWIGGWGDTCADGSGCIPAAFQQAEVPIQPDATCGDDLLGGDSAFDAATMLCAGILDTAGGPTNGVDTCFGDSGGPLIVSDGSGGWRLAGITSFGVTAECAGQKFGFFTRVDAFRDWVNEQLACGMGGGPDACAPTNPTPQAPDPDLSSWSALGHVVVQLRPGYDAGGMDGYAYVWDTNPTTVPNPVSDSYAAADSTSLDSGPVADGSSLYLHIRAYDAANNPADTTVDYGPFWIDSTAPTNPALSSGTATDTWTRTTAISVNLAGAADNLSGIAGYSQVWDTSPVTDPDTSVDTDLESTTSPHFQFAPALYLHVRTVDVAGNVSAASVTLGPFRIDAQKPTAPGRPRLISRTRTSVTFAWPASTDGRGIARYFVLRKMSNGVWKTVKALPGSKRRATITGLKHARSYSFAIRASDPLPTANLSSSSPAAQLKTA